MSEILLTYIVPVYNTERYVINCLESLVHQGIDDGSFEVLVVDDGSTDASRSLVEQFSRTFPQVRLLTQENKGVSAARNLALDNARGRYVQFVDSDDYIEENAMSPLLKRAVDEDLDVLMFGFKWIDGNGVVMKHSYPKDDMSSTPVMTGVDFLTQHGLMQYVCWYLVKREHLDKNALRFNTSLVSCEDGALVPGILLPATRVGYTDAAPYCYVAREDSATRTIDDSRMRRRITSQIDAAAVISDTAKKYEASSGNKAPAAVLGLKNLYLYFSMTSALTCGSVKETVEHMRQLGLFPFPCIGPEVNYMESKWRYIHRLMMHPRLWQTLSKMYKMIKK